MYDISRVKPDWEESKERFRRFWNREKTDRPVTVLTAPSDSPLSQETAPPVPEDPMDKWLEIEENIQRKKVRIAGTAFLGDTIPNIAPELGPGTLGLYLGSIPEYMPTTVWYHKCFDSIEKAKGIFSEDNDLWQWTLECAEKIVESQEGDFIPSLPDFIENLDTAAQLLGTIETVMAATDTPDELHRLLDEITDSFRTVYTRLWEILYPGRDESVFMAFNIWAPGRVVKIQTDIAALLSPGLFEEFAVPRFNRQLEDLDCSIYHLDGPDAIYSLDSLLKIDKLDVIQWTPGAGQPDGDDPCWDEIYRKTLDAGKGIWAGMRPEAAPEFIRKFGSEGVLLSLGRVESEEKGREIISSLEG